MRDLTLRAVKILLIPLLLLIGSSVASAADTLSVHLPSATHSKTLLVTGRAPVGATVSSAQADLPVTADALGWFALNLNLAEGSNTVTVTATKQGGQPLTFSGKITVNWKAPALTVRMIRSTNEPVQGITGFTTPGATVKINGTAVKVDAKGWFWYQLNTNKRDTEYTVVSEDGAGNRSEFRSQMLFVTRPLWANSYGSQATYSAPPGSVVVLKHTTDFWGEPDTVGRLAMDDRGMWTGWLLPRLGWNHFFMEVTTPEGITYIDDIVLVKWLEISMPDQTTRDLSLVLGKTLPGYQVLLNGEAVKVDPDGTFGLTLRLRPGPQEFKVRVVAPSTGTWAERTYTVTRLSPQEPVYSSTIMLSRQEAGAVFLVGEDRYPVDANGTVTIPLKLTPGSNQVLLRLITAARERRYHLFDLTYIPSTFVRLTIDKDTAEVNGDPRTLAAPPVMLEGNTYVPLRFLGELLGAKVEWEQSTKTVTYTKGSRVLQLTIGSTTARVDGKEVLLPAPPRLVNNGTLVPLRFISESLGAKVSWDGVTRSITLMVPVQ